jgi:hypothetical protein
MKAQRLNRDNPPSNTRLPDACALVVEHPPRPLPPYLVFASRPCLANGRAQFRSEVTA